RPALVRRRGRAAAGSLGRAPGESARRPRARDARRRCARTVAGGRQGADAFERRLAGALIMFFLIVIAVVAVLIGIWYAQYRARLARMNAVAALGAKVGFTFSAEDPDFIVSMPFVLFSRGDGRGVENVLSGTHDGIPMRLFDYWYYDETRDSRGGRSRQ